MGHQDILRKENKSLRIDIINEKIFIKLAKILGYEIIDQNNFKSPTLNKDLNEDLSDFNKKSIVLPLGEVKITKKLDLY